MDGNGIRPLAVTTKVNDRGYCQCQWPRVTHPTRHRPCHPRPAFAPYFDALSSLLNTSFLVGDSPWWPFRRAPEEVQVVIHSHPIAFRLEDTNKLFPCFAESVLHSKKICILAARYLNAHEQSREGKTATSVIVLVHPRDFPTMGSSIRLISRSQPIEYVYSSNRYTQCKNCWGYGNVAPRGLLADTVYPICSLNHTHASHRCPNPTCSGNGNLKATPGCCSSSPSYCVNCGDNNSAIHRDCESHPSPPSLRRSTTAVEVVPQPPAGDEMDTATDDQDVSRPPSPTLLLYSAFKMPTPMDRRITILPAPVGPPQGTGSLLSRKHLAPPP